MLKTEDLKTAYLKAGDSKYALTCWEPQKSKFEEHSYRHNPQFFKI